MEVKVLSREIIKPSSSMPPHPKTFQLSFFDELQGTNYNPFIYFYHLNGMDGFDTKNAICKLKKSLSETLSCFYLVAGRVKDRSIECNDEGSLFLEASIDCSMSDILKEPHWEMLSNLLPCSPICIEPIEESAQVVAQFNTFKCGTGIAISFCFLHKLIDGMTWCSFLRTWASINREPLNSSKKVARFDYNEISSLFPQIDQSMPLEKESTLCNLESRNCLQRFVFNGKVILDLKERAKSANIPNPTSVEVVTAFIWKYAMEASLIKSPDFKQYPSYAYHVVNLRKRMKPSLPENSIGNMSWVVFSQYKYSNKVELELNELVNLLRQSFAKIDDDYIQKLTRQVDGQVGAMSMIHEWKNNDWCRKENTFRFSSLRNMNFNDVDFGWGKPIWVAFVALPNLLPFNFTFLLETISGDGIEAWMVHDEEEMKLLMQNPKFLEFASINPSIPLPEDVIP